MSDLVVIAFPSEAKAEEVRTKILELQKEYLIELGDAAIAVKQPDGTVRLNQLINTTAAGAVSGTFWGTLVGLIFLMPLAGAAIGAASGALGGWLTDVGVNDTFMKEVAESLQPGNAALFLLIRKLTTDKVLEDLRASAARFCGPPSIIRKRMLCAMPSRVCPRSCRRPPNQKTWGQRAPPLPTVLRALLAKRGQSGAQRHAGAYSPKRCRTISRWCGARRCSKI